MSIPRAVEERHRALVALLRRHNYLYYVKDAPEISDFAYDALFRELKALEKGWPSLSTPDSPTQKVGGYELVSEGALPKAGEPLGPVRHTLPMISLENAMNEEELADWFGRVREGLGRSDSPYVAEPKIDGLSVEAVYRDGLLSIASTRGTGEVGEDVTPNLKTVAGIPLLLSAGGPAPALIEVRGEVYMGKADFAALNKRLEQAGEKTFANPRNAAAGSLRQKDPSVTASRPLRAIFYGVASREGLTIERQSDLIPLLKRFGLPTHDRWRLCASEEEAREFYRALARDRAGLDYEIDGCVLKVDSFADQRRLGLRSRTPRFAIAYKFEAEKAVTVVEEIGVQVGPTGALTPVARLRPVSVAGVVVRNATLHNQDEVDRKDVRVGDTVVIHRAGDVIPEVVEVLVERRTGGERKFKMPEKCPTCGAAVRAIEDEAVHRCSNYDCPDQIQGRIRHFAIRDAMDIEGLGEKLVEQLVGAGLVKDPGDLYFLTAEKVAALERKAEKSAQNLIQAIERSRERPLHRVLFGLGIRHVGEVMARDVAEHFGTIERIMGASLEELTEVHGAGPNVADSIHRFFRAPVNQRLIEKLRRGGVKFTPVERKKGGLFDGMTVVFTGTLSTLTREQGQEIVRAEGGRAASSVSTETSLVVGGEKAGAKLKTAAALRVRVVNEAEFRRMAGLPP